MKHPTYSEGAVQLASNDRTAKLLSDCNRQHESMTPSKPEGGAA